MRLLMSVLVVLATTGCVTVPDSLYVDGTRMRMGLYIPYGGQLYGIQFLEYLNGSVLCSSSNSPLVSIQREHYSTNSYFKISDTIENTNTRIETYEKHETDAVEKKDN